MTQAQGTGQGHTPRARHVYRKESGTYVKSTTGLIHMMDLKEGFFWDFSFFMYDIQHCFICRPSHSTVSEDAGIEPRTVATTALTGRRSN